jgi:hypothetical protein
MSITDDTPTHDDRAVQALIDHGWTGEWDWTIGPDDLANGVALVLRTVRDDLILEHLNGRIQTLIQVEDFINARVEKLTGQRTITGDTTE